MVEHQPRLLGSRVRLPAGAFAIFFRICQSFTSNFPSPLSLPLSFSSSSFPFLFLSFRPFVCTRGNLSIDYQFTEVTNSPIKTPSHKDSSIKVNFLCFDQYMYTLDKEKGVKWEVV